MARIRSVPRQHYEELGRRPRVDLTPYITVLQALRVEQAGLIELEAGEKASTVVGHLKRAAAQLGLRVHVKTNQSGVYFVRDNGRAPDVM